MTIPTVVYASKDFYLTDALSEQIENIKAAGLIEYWHNRPFDKRSVMVRDVKYPKVIKMKHLFGCFQLLAFGLLISLIAFIFESLKRKLNL